MPQLFDWELASNRLNAKNRLAKELAGTPWSTHQKSLIHVVRIVGEKAWPFYPSTRSINFWSFINNPKWIFANLIALLTRLQTPARRQLRNAKKHCWNSDSNVCEAWCLEITTEDHNICLSDDVTLASPSHGFGSPQFSVSRDLRRKNVLKKLFSFHIKSATLQINVFSCSTAIVSGVCRPFFCPLQFFFCPLSRV